MGKVFSPDAKSLILQYHSSGLNYSTVARKLKQSHGIPCSRQGVRTFIMRYKRTGRLATASRRKTPKLKKTHKKFIELWISQNPELTSAELKKKLKDSLNVDVSESRIRQIRNQQGWTVKRTQYCQLISIKNTIKREIWCLQMLAARETFRNVIFVDETSVEMSSTGRMFFYRVNSNLEKLPAKAPKPKHALKVHMWAGISYQGRTDCCIFTGVMDSEIYQQILEKNLLPFAAKKFPDGFRLYQDNDSKHCSRSTKAWMERHNILDLVMDVPASSPDINPIENVWSALKDYLQRKVKPRKKAELVGGIRKFWSELSAAQCGRYIDHIHKVIPEVVLNKGGPTRF